MRVLLKDVQKQLELYQKKNFIISNDLLEIDYGDAEGMKISSLLKKYSYLKKL